MDPLSLGILLGFIFGTAYVEFLWYRRAQKNGKDKICQEVREQVLKELFSSGIDIRPKKKKE
jgi:hypothetical protein